MSRTGLRSPDIVFITGNNKCPFKFNLELITDKKSLKITAKNVKTKNVFMGEFTSNNLQKIGFYQNIKGFYNRLKSGIESTSSNELKASYYIHKQNVHKSTNNGSNGGSNSVIKNVLLLTLEESSKYDDDISKWTVPLKQIELKDSDKLRDKLNELSLLVNNNYNKNEESIQFIIKQVKQKFNNEKQARIKLENKLDEMTKLMHKMNKQLNQLQTQVFETKTRENDENISTKKSVTSISNELNNKTQFLEDKIETIDKKYNDVTMIINKKLDDLRPKLVRLKGRKDFSTEQGFIEYITKKLDIWDSTKFGPILVRVKPNALGKAKHFFGYVGEPQKWNNTICRVQWYGLGKKQPESVEWKALDIFLPLSSFYYPDPYNNRSNNYSSSNNNIM